MNHHHQVCSLQLPMKDVGKVVSRKSVTAVADVLVGQWPRLLARQRPRAEHVLRVTDAEAVLRHRSLHVRLKFRVSRGKIDKQVAQSRCHHRIEGLT